MCDEWTKCDDCPPEKFIDEIEACGFECIMGDLKDHRGWIALKKRVADLQYLFKSGCKVESIAIAKYVESQRRVAELEGERQWLDARTAKPPTLMPVFVQFTTLYGKPQTTVAEYVPSKTVKEESYISDEYVGDGLGEYDEDKDEYYVIEGWFEAQYSADIHYKMHETVTHWMFLPKGR